MPEHVKIVQNMHACLQVKQEASSYTERRNCIFPNRGGITSRTSGQPSRQCLFQWPATSYCHQRSGPSRLAGTDPTNSDTYGTATGVGRGVHAFGRVRTRVVRASVRDEHCVCNIR